jgi:hypothetical protein
MPAGSSLPSPCSARSFPLPCVICKHGGPLGWRLWGCGVLKPEMQLLSRPMALCQQVLAPPTQGLSCACPRRLGLGSLYVFFGELCIEILRLFGGMEIVLCVNLRALHMVSMQSTFEVHTPVAHLKFFLVVLDLNSGTCTCFSYFLDTVFCFCLGQHQTMILLPMCPV